MCSFLSLSLRVTPRMALRQRISNTSSLRVSLDLRVHVSDAYVAMGTIRALYRRIFRALHIDFFFQMASLSRPNAVDASPIRLITSLALFGTTLPRNTNSSTCSTSSPSMTIRWSLGEIVLHLAPFLFSYPIFGMHFRAVRLRGVVSRK